MATSELDKDRIEKLEAELDPEMRFRPLLPTAAWIVAVAPYREPDDTRPDVGGRYDAEVYVFDTRAGQLTHRIPAGQNPHGLTVWPQPGRYSFGHTGNIR